MKKAKLWHSKLTGNWVLDITHKTTGKIMQRYIINKANNK